MGKTDDPRAGYVEIASKSFATHGFHGVSLAALAKEAGVTKQALLHFFGTKERLYAEVLAALAERLCAEIDAAAQPEPADHLLAYFQAFRSSALERPDDVRLVVRALLDSIATARKWPLKPYLDTLTDLAQQTQGGRRAKQDELLAWLSQMIGMIQYMAISAPATSGMYGSETAAAVAGRLEAIVSEAVVAFTQNRRNPVPEAT